jgi:hypothetical protein
MASFLTKGAVIQETRRLTFIAGKDIIKCGFLTIIR